MLQLVQTPDGHVTGQFTVVTADANGRITDGNASVTGAIDGQNITLELRPISFLPVATHYSGTVDSARIQLSGAVEGGQLNRMALQRGQVSAFEAWSAQLRNHAHAHAQAHAAADRQAKIEAARRDLVARIDGLIRKMDSFGNTVARNINRYPATETRYRSITAKMNAYLDRERALARDPRAAVARSQIEVQISQGDVAMSQSQVEFENFNIPLKQSNDAIRSELAQTEPECEPAREPTRKEPVSQSEMRVVSVCLRLLDATKAYRPSVDQIRKAYEQAQAVYSEEHRKQGGILAEANRISQ
jgi:hypothetical protein